MYDSSAYDLIVKFWGDSYLTESNYGGVFEIQRALRECYNADVKEIQKNIDIIINSGTPSHDLRFLDYAMFSTNNIIGGNPEIMNITERIKTIKANPVFIYGRKLPLWQAISPGKIRDNMKIHLNNINKKMMDYIEFNKNKIKDMFLQEAKKEQYTLIKQSYAIYDYSRLSFSQYYQYNCGIHRYDCYNCKETPNKDRSGFSRACVTTENKLSAVEHTEESMGTLKYIWDNNIDADGFYQISFMQKDKDDIIMQTSSRKIRSGCMQENKDNDHDIIIPNIGWKWGTPIYWCIKCIPWVRYVSEYGQTQEYHECSCPKTI
jgi:hypothetical protein